MRITFQEHIGQMAVCPPSKKTYTTASTTSTPLFTPPSLLPPLPSTSISPVYHYNSSPPFPTPSQSQMFSASPRKRRKTQHWAWMAYSTTYMIKCLSSRFSLSRSFRLQSRQDSFPHPGDSHSFAPFSKRERTLLASSYRPIALLCTDYKIFSKIRKIQPIPPSHLSWSLKQVHQWEVYTPWGTAILPLDQNYSRELPTAYWQWKSVWSGITWVAISLLHHFRILRRVDHASSSYSLKQHQESHCQQQTLLTVSHPVRGETRRPSCSYPLHPVHRATPKTTRRTGHQKSITLQQPCHRHNSQQAPHHPLSSLDVWILVRCQTQQQKIVHHHMLFSSQFSVFCHPNTMKILQLSHIALEPCYSLWPLITSAVRHYNELKGSPYH